MPIFCNRIADFLGLALGQFSSSPVAFGLPVFPMRSFSVGPLKHAFGGRMTRLFRRVPHMQAVFPCIWRAPRVRLGRNFGRPVRTNALTLTDDLEVVALRRLSIETVVSRSDSDVDELVINGDANEVAKTESVRRELETAYSNSPRSSSSDHRSPLKEREALESRWASKASTSGRPILVRTSQRRRRMMARRKGSAGALRRPSSPTRFSNGRSSKEMLATMKRRGGMEDVETQRAVIGFLETKMEKAKIKPRQRTRNTDAISVFISKLCGCGVLSRNEEKLLAAAVRRGQCLIDRRKAMEKELGRKVSPAEVAGDMNRSSCEWEEDMEDCRRAKSLMMQYNYGLVVTTAQKFVNKGLDLADMILEGRQGLIRAVEKFDPERGIKFSTYAMYWIRQAIQRSISNESRVIRLPIHVCEIVNKIARVQKELEGKDGSLNRVTPDEIAKTLQIPVDKVKLYMRVARAPRQLDAPAHNMRTHKMEYEPTTLEELVPSGEGGDDEAQQAMIRETLENVLKTLPPRERNVIRMRYGLHSRGNPRVMTFTDIGRAYGVTNERIRQIEQKALKKLRLPWRRCLLDLPSSLTSE